MNPSEESAESSGGQTLQTEYTSSSEVDYSGRRALVLSIREEARDAYSKYDYATAIKKYTIALKVHVGEPPAADASDNLRAVLLANRAAALLMLDAYEAASVDCQTALKFVSDLEANPSVVPADCGPAMRAKLFSRMGKAFLRLGKDHEAEQAFCNAIHVSNTALGLASQISVSDETERTKQLLSQFITDAESGKIEVSRCREASESLLRCGNVTSHDPSPLARRNALQALLLVNKALGYAPAAENFHEKKVLILASLKRWRELAGYCERLAASHTKFDDVFDEDLASQNPFPGVQRAEFLEATYFNAQDPVESSTKKLGNRAAAEAAVRLPPALLPHYLRALRLEERWPQATSVMDALDKLSDSRLKFPWLPSERDKLGRTAAGKDRGDSLYRNAFYDLAAAQYTSCLTIDGEGFSAASLGEVSNAGGRLHAILHCNRAACHFANKKYHDAVTDCTSALRIHSNYMKAMLRRCRCYARLERYDEAIVECNRWLGLVEKAKASPQDADLTTTPCLFDSPKDIDDEDFEKVKKELEDLTTSKQMAENAARSEASYNAGSRQRFQESYSRFHPSDAQQRREQFYSQKSSSSRHWDSFAGRSPKKEHKTGGSRQGASRQQQQQQQQQRRSHSQNGFFGRTGSSGQGRNNQQQRSQSQNGFQGGGGGYRQQRRVNVSPVSDPSKNYYAILEIAHNATEAQIKKAYRRLALKYHPDKNKDAGAIDKFRRLNAAYETLNDSSARRAYDEKLARGTI